MDKVYIRKGRRFVAVPNVVGMFYDGVNFTKEKTPASFAFCYDQNGNTAMLTLLNAEKGRFTWFQAQRDCIKPPYHLPSREQILLVRTRYRSLFNNSLFIGDTIWSCDAVENRFNYAWTLLWNSNYLYDFDKDCAARVLLFFETEIV